MDSDFPLPPIPGTSGASNLSSVGPYGVSGNYAQTNSPFFSVANQFLPRNLHDIIRWSKFITMQNPVVTEVIRKFSTYPITDFIVDTKSDIVRTKYEEVFKSFKLKTSLHSIGFDYYTIGNVFVSIYFPVIRNLSCPHCEATYPAKNANFLTFKNYGFHGTCPACGGGGAFNRKDIKSNHVEDMNLIKWDPIHIITNHNPITGECEYYYKIPNDIKRAVQQGDKLFVNTVPWGLIEAIRNNQDFKFDRGHIFHLKNISAGHEIKGVAIPPILSLFNLVFYQTVLRRANESISTDFMAPMRVIFPTPQTGNSDPVAAMSLRNFVGHMTNAMMQHKKDKNHVLIAPMPVGYQNISGDGKALLVSQEIQQAEESILLSLGVSREILTGVTNWQSSTVGLRLLENTLYTFTDQIETLLEWVMLHVSKYLDLETCKVTLAPFKLTDDDSLRQMLVQAEAAGKASTSTMYEAFGMNYDDELESKQKDLIKQAVKDAETKFLVDQAVFVQSKNIVDKFDSDNDYRTALAKAMPIAQQLYTADPVSQIEVLDQLQLTDYPLFMLVSRLIESYNENNSGGGMEDPNDPSQQASAGAGSTESAGAVGKGGSGSAGASGGGKPPPSGGMKPSNKGQRPEPKKDK